MKKAKPLKPIPFPLTPRQRDEFWTKVAFTQAGCWEWQRNVLRNGYGQKSFGGKMYLAHRVAWTDMNGPIPQSMTLDHLCRNRKCVRPNHLEPVSIKVNILRGNGMAAKNKRQTHCHNGHLFNEVNTYVCSEGSRNCRICNRKKTQLYRLRRKEDLNI
jgi:hypothetical protein